MLSDVDIYDLAQQLRIPNKIECYYKDNLKMSKFEPEKAYIVNLASETDDNFGTHYTLLFSKRNAFRENALEYLYFDSEGGPPPLEVLEFIGKPKIPYSDKPIQGRFNNSCGFYCLALLHYLQVFPNRLDNMYLDVEMFLDLFDDTQEKVDTLHNEMMLKEFFKQIPHDIETKHIQHID